MQITKYGHSCLHIVDDRASLLTDPGAFSGPFEDLTGLTGILITHQHPDHVDVERLKTVLATNPDAPLFADPDTVATLAGQGVEARAVQTGDLLEDLGTQVQVWVSDHAIIYGDLPGITNACYLVGDRLFLPGDSFTLPGVDVDILALPVSAPWMAVKEAIDYLHEVAPAIAVPIHEKVLANTAMVYGLIERMGPDATRWVDLDDGRPRDL
ncbi:MBL fold metallo-hydrolase [Nakamurella sp.]|uniref:MBL fold metallo-hydrolase n=1 Tax=Nakamurella sp. TaxID=1869182 RepID=UPI003B3ADB9E